MTLLYGLTRFVTVLIASIILVWVTEYTMLSTIQGFSPLLLTPVIVPIAISVWVNDMSVQGFKKSVAPFSISLVIGLVTNILMTQLTLGFIL